MIKPLFKGDKVEESVNINLVVVRFVVYRKNGENLDLIIDEIRKLCDEGQTIWKDHATRRMKQRDIKTQDIENCISTGELIEYYQEDYPVPSCLVLGLSVNNRYLHVVCSIYQNMLCVITSYFPNLDEWEDDYKTRKVVK